MNEVCQLCVRPLAGVTGDSLPICTDCERLIPSLSISQRIDLAAKVNEHLIRKRGASLTAETVDKIGRLFDIAISRVESDDENENWWRGES